MQPHRPFQPLDAMKCNGREGSLHFSFSSENTTLILHVITRSRKKPFFFHAQHGPPSPSALIHLSHQVREVGLFQSHPHSN